MRAMLPCLHLSVSLGSTLAAVIVLAKRKLLVQPRAAGSGRSGVPAQRPTSWYRPRLVHSIAKWQSDWAECEMIGGPFLARTLGEGCCSNDAVAAETSRIRPLRQASTHSG